MSALVIDFSAAMESRRVKQAVRAVRAPSQARHPALSHDFKFWNGASGMRYVHTVYSLFECPDLPDANVILARRLPSGEREIIAISRVENQAPSLNLAQVRREAAERGANEVHVHFLAANAQHRALIESDLEAGATQDGRSRVAS